MLVARSLSSAESSAAACSLLARSHASIMAVWGVARSESASSSVSTLRADGGGSADTVVMVLLSRAESDRGEDPSSVAAVADGRGTVGVIDQDTLVGRGHCTGVRHVVPAMRLRMRSRFWRASLPRGIDGDRCTSRSAMAARSASLGDVGGDGVSRPLPMSILPSEWASFTKLRKRANAEVGRVPGDLPSVHQQWKCELSDAATQRSSTHDAPWWRITGADRRH